MLPLNYPFSFSLLFYPALTRSWGWAGRGCFRDFDMLVENKTWSLIQICIQNNDYYIVKDSCFLILATAFILLECSFLFGSIEYIKDTLWPVPIGFSHQTWSPLQSFVNVYRGIFCRIWYVYIQNTGLDIVRYICSLMLPRPYILLLL